MTSSFEPPRYLILAKILRPHGVRGEVAVQALTDYPERFRQMETVFIGESAQQPTRLRQYTLDGARPDKKTHWLLRFQGIDDRDAAEPLRNRYIFVALDDAVPLADDEVYLFQVIGLQAETPGGEILGRVVDVLETGANDVYVLRGDRYGEVLIPAIDGVVLSIDVASGRMLVEPLPGLLPDLSDPSDGDVPDLDQPDQFDPSEPADTLS